MIHRLTADEIVAALDSLTEDDMARARASLARDVARREQAAINTPAPDAHTAPPAPTRNGTP